MAYCELAQLMECGCGADTEECVSTWGGQMTFEEYRLCPLVKFRQSQGHATLLIVIM